MNFHVVSFVQALLSGKGSFSASWQFCCLLPGCPAHFVIHLVVFNTCSGNLCLQVRSWDFICNVQLNLKCFQNIRFWTSEFYKHRLRVLRVRIIQSREKKIQGHVSEVSSSCFLYLHHLYILLGFSTAVYLILNIPFKHVNFTSIFKMYLSTCKSAQKLFFLSGHVPI